MKTVERHKKTDFGDVWYVNAADGTYRFAVYKYDDDNDTIYLSNVFVKEDSRRQGYGNEILASAEDYANRLGASVICLKVLSGSDVHRWYKRHGYEDLEKDEEERGYMWMKKELKRVNESIWADIRNKSLGQEDRGEDFDIETEDKIKEKDFNIFSEDIVFLGFENTLDGFKKSVHHHRFMGYYRKVVDIKTSETWEDIVVPFVEKNWDKRGYSKIVDEKVEEKEDELSKIGFKKEPGKTISKMLDDWWENIDEDTKEKISDYFYAGAEEKYYENQNPDYNEFNGDDFDVDDEWSNADWMTCVKLYMEYNNKTNESVWGDIRKKSLGQEDRIEDSIENLDMVGLYEYILSHYELTDKRHEMTYGTDNMSITISRSGREELLLTYGFGEVHYFGNLSKDKQLESILTKLFKVSSAEKEHYIIEPKKKVTNQFFIDVLDCIIDNKKSTILRRKEDVNESVWGDIRKKSIGQEERAENDVNAMTHKGFVEYLKSNYEGIENRLIGWEVATYGSGQLATPIYGYPSISGIRTECAFLFLDCKEKVAYTNKCIIKYAPELLKKLNEKYDLWDDDPDYENYIIINPTDTLKNPDHKYFLDLLNFILDNLDEDTLHVLTKKLNEMCDGVPGGATPANVGGMGEISFPGPNGEPGSGDIPMPTGKVYQQVAPFGLFVKSIKAKKKRKKKFRKEDEPCVHSPNAKVYDYVDDYREYVDRTYNNMDRK